MDYMQLLREHDDPTHWEYPPGFDYRAAKARFGKFAGELSAALGVFLEIEAGNSIQDASFHSQVFLPPADGPEVSIRFSNFGDMVTVGEGGRLPEGTLGTIRELFGRYGYVYVPACVLDQPYTGGNPGVTGIETWRILYFDYV